MLCTNIKNQREHGQYFWNQLVFLCSFFLRLSVECKFLKFYPQSVTPIRLIFSHAFICFWTNKKKPPQNYAQISFFSWKTGTHCRLFFNCRTTSTQILSFYTRIIELEQVNTCKLFRFICFSTPFIMWLIYKSIWFFERGKKELH